MVKHSYRSATGLHIPSLQIEEYLDIRNLEVQHLGQVNLFAGETGLLRSALLEFLVNEYPNDSSVEMHPYAWKTVRYMAKEETFYLGNPDLMAPTIDHRRDDGGLPSVVIRHMNEDIIQFKDGRTVTRYFHLANVASVFKAGGLLDPRLNLEFGNPMRMPAGQDARSLVSPRIPVVRETNGSYDYGYNFAESGVTADAEFREVFRIGADTLRLMLVISSMVFLSMKAKDESKVAVFLIDGLDVAVNRDIQAKFWQLVFEEVRSLDMQLLATTNSLDCIAGFADVGTSIQEPTAAYYRLEQGENKTHSIHYDPYTLQNSLEFNIDPR